MASENLLADKIASRLLALMDELVAMTTASGTAGSKPNASGAILSADHQGYRANLLSEVKQLQQQLDELGYMVDASGNAVPSLLYSTSYGVT